MHSDESAFIAAIKAAPDDDAPRLVYADWLDERGECERAEFIRVQCALERLPDKVQQIVFVDPTYSDNGHAKWNREVREVDNSEKRKLRDRERELWKEHCGSWFIRPMGVSKFITVWSLSGRDVGRSVPCVIVRRGFVDGIQTAAADWLAHGDAICERHPVREVRLTTTMYVICRTGSQPPYFLSIHHYRGGSPAYYDPNGTVEVTRPLPDKWEEMNLVEACLKAQWPGVTFRLPEASDESPLARASRFMDTANL